MFIQTEWTVQRVERREVAQWLDQRQFPKPSFPKTAFVAKPQSPKPFSDKEGFDFSDVCS